MMTNDFKRLAAPIAAALALLSVLGWALAQPRPASGQLASQAGQNVSLWYSPNELDFGPVGIGELSSGQAVTVTNSGDTVIHFAGGAAPAPFSAAQNCGGDLAPGASCQYFYSFAPTATGQFSTTTGPSSDAGPIQVTLHGTAVGPDFTYSPRSIDFGRALNGTTTAAHTVTIRNTGRAMLTFTGGAAPEPFSAAQNCAPSVPAGETCEYFYSFSPTDTGIFTTTTGPGSNAGKPMEVTLRGQGVGILIPSGINVSPLELDFGPVGLGMLSVPQQVIIRNTSLLTLTNFTGGGVSPPFSGTQNCAGGVPPFESCQYTFRFSPTASGVFSATSSSSTSHGSFTILLHGTGQDASLSVSPISLDFGPVPLGETSPPQRVHIVNTSETTLANFAGGEVSPPFFESQNCAGGVPPGGQCQYTFTYSPSSPGRFTATSSSSTNGGPFTVHLSGGLVPPAVEKRFLPGAVLPGHPATLELAVHNPNPNHALTEVAVVDSLPAGLTVAAPPTYNTSPECGTPSFSPTDGASTLTFTGGTIEGGDTCLLQVEVVAAQVGTYVNTTGAPAAALPAGEGTPASATLRVGHVRFLPVTFR